MPTTTPLIAFGWTNPALLGWLAVAVAPLLIHLLSRRRYRRTEWAAMRFLVAAMRESRRRLRLEHLLLLLVRTLIIVLLVLAVADPYVQSSALFFTGGGERTHRVFVLDGSYSMAYTIDGESRFGRAKELIAKIVRAAPRGDAFSLVLMAQPPRGVVDTPALEPAEFLRELETVVRTDGTADLPGTLEQVESTLSAARRAQPGLRRCEVYFLTDLCRVGWLPELSSAAGGRFVRRARELDRSASLTVIDLGQPGAENVAITRLETVGSPATLTQPVELSATIHNFGTRNREGYPVELFVDARRVGRRQIDLPAGKSRSVSFTHRFDRPGEQVVEARIEEDRLTVDDRRWLIAPVHPATQVLCIDGRPGGPAGGATAYLTTALAAAEGPGQSAAIDAAAVPEGALRELDLSRYDCVFLCDVAQVTSGEAKMLGDYVRAGGGLVFFLGERVVADRYDRELFDNEPLLPARLRGVIDQRVAGIDPLDYAHPIVEPFRGRERAGLLTTPVEKYFKLELPDETAARVVLATLSGDPLIVEQPVGRGGVVLVATSADTTWTLMPLWPSYVPLVRQLVAHAAAGRAARHNRLVGETLDGEPADGTADDTARIRLPDGREAALPVRHEDGARRWSFDATERSGLYTVEFGGPDPTASRFAVNVDTVESDLEKLGEARLRDEVWPGVAFDYRTTWSESTAASPEPTAHRGQPARMLLHGVLALLLVETFLAWRFGHHDPRTANHDNGVMQR
ncbi:MAG: VWA domain-containing protein [Pirellulaceae bacterium]|nr:VWA domain-containing protein [Pirellulaceae bacterium]